MPEPALLAAIDLGSNSFRLLIAQTSGEPQSPQLKPLDSIKRSVRLAAGLDGHRRLDALAQQRGLDALGAFSTRIRAFAPERVRAVATSTLRIARNAADFLADAEATLGFPIEVISGQEEARLIYLGVAHHLPERTAPRLVIDIGGGSTECIVGHGHTPKVLESISVGCVSSTVSHFSDGQCTAERFEIARNAARRQLAEAARRSREIGWQQAIGTSGTAKALSQLARSAFGAERLDRQSLGRMREALVKAGSMEAAPLAGLKPDRRAVLAGGLAVMSAVFDEFELESIDYCPAALRDGVLRELLERRQGEDSRALSTRQMVRRYGLDPRRGERLAEMAQALYDQAAREATEERLRRRELLGWTAQLVEIGTSISSENYHRHSAYILQHANMAGFTQAEQQLMSTLALGQTGGLRKLRGLINDDLGWLTLIALRLAVILQRHAVGGDTPLPAVFFRRGALRIELLAQWAQAEPLLHQALVEEARLWSESRLLTVCAYQLI